MVRLPNRGDRTVCLILRLRNLPLCAHRSDIVQVFE